MLGQTFSPFSYTVYLFHPTCHNHATPLHLHLITHYLDHLWSSTRLESLALSLHSFESCILIHVCSSWAQVFTSQSSTTFLCLDVPRSHEHCCMYVRHPLRLSLRVTFSCIHSVHSLHASAFLIYSKEVADMLDMCLDPQINTNLYDRHLVHAA